MRSGIITLIVFAILLLLVVTIGGCMWGMPKYAVYKEALYGEAELKRAEQNRQIKIEEAKAVKESANMLADAEVIRAEGVAKANEIIGASLRNNEAYLRYLWVNGLQDAKNAQTIYVATEAGMPIMEANRFNMQNQTDPE